MSDTTLPRRWRNVTLPRPAQNRRPWRVIVATGGLTAAVVDADDNTIIFNCSVAVAYLIIGGVNGHPDLLGRFERQERLLRDVHETLHRTKSIRHNYPTFDALYRRLDEYLFPGMGDAT